MYCKLLSLCSLSPAIHLRRGRGLAPVAAAGGVVTERGASARYETHTAVLY